MKSARNDHPVFFIKLPNALAGPNQSIRIPKETKTQKVDFESELAVIIKEDCSNVPIEEAMSKILGYTLANDISSRDWQKEWGGGQFCRGKSFDGFCPIGPSIVTKDEIPDPHHLPLKGYLNDKLMQNGNTSQLIFKIPELISFISQGTTIPAGAIILTGTPAGVGHARKPPIYLKAGDVYRIESAPIGSLQNNFI